MANAILVNIGTPIVWADVTDFSGTANGYTRTAQIDLTSIASAAARQGDKVDFGDTHSTSYSVFVGVEMNVAPTAGKTIDYYMSFSASGTAGTGNEGGASGADGAYKAGEELEWLAQTTYVGSLVLTADASTTVQIQRINSDFSVPQRYGSPIVYNGGGQAFFSDAVEMFIAFVPNVVEVQ